MNPDSPSHEDWLFAQLEDRKHIATIDKMNEIRIKLERGEITRADYLMICYEIIEQRFILESS